MKGLVNGIGPAAVGAFIFLMLSGSALSSDEKPTIELGVIVALSGEAVLQGARLAADEINSLGGLLDHHLAFFIHGRR